MITDVTRALASVLVEGSPTINLNQVGFTHPGLSQVTRPALGVYLYALQCIAKRPACKTSENTEVRGGHAEITAGTRWIDLYFLIIPWDWTHLGVQNLLSEILYKVLQKGLIREDRLPPELRGYGNLPISVANTSLSELTQIWQSLGVPLQPSLNVTVSIPCRLNSELNFANFQITASS